MNRNLYLRQTATELVKALQDAGFEAYFVGGCVRDELLGIPVKDFDIATSARPEQIRKVFSSEHLLEIGEAFGIIAVVKNKVPFEIATFRGELGYTDGRHPQEIFYTNIKEDASRRDFTINAMYYDPVSEQYHDFFSGKQDLEQQCIRCVGDANRRFEEDHLRMLRGIRFAVQKGFLLHPQTSSAISENAHLITRVSWERICDELLGILQSQWPHTGLLLLEKLGLLKEILPEVSALKKHKIVKNGGNQWSSLLESFKMVFSQDINTRLALLFVNVVLFSGLESAMAHLNQLRLSKKTIQDVQWLLQHYKLFERWKTLEQKDRYQMAVHPLFPDSLADIYLALNKNASHLAEKHVFDVYVDYYLLRQDVVRFSQTQKFDLITGNDLKGRFEGKAIGDALAKIRERYLNGQLDSRESCLGYLNNLSSGNAIEMDAKN